MAHEPSEPLYDGLTPLEVTVLELVAQGYTAAEIGQQLSYSYSYVKWVLKQIHSKLGVHKAPGAVAFALHYGLIHCPLCHPNAEEALTGSSAGNRPTYGPTSAPPLWPGLADTTP